MQHSEVWKDNCQPALRSLSLKAELGPVYMEVGDPR